MSNLYKQRKLQLYTKAYETVEKELNNVINYYSHNKRKKRMEKQDMGKW